MIIFIDNAVYDISTFIDEHPGGNHVFKREADLTSEFNDVGHSSYAVSLLSNYKVRDIQPDDVNYNAQHKIKYNQTKVGKLFTREDNFNMHKILGVICLINYMYLFIDLAYTGFNEKLSLREINLPFITLSWCHLVLSLSSLQFLVPRTRTGIQPMIWQEFRLHSILFASRSLIIVNLIYFLGHSHLCNILRFIIIILTMVLADIVTNRYSSNQDRTTASMPYWTTCSPSLQARIKYFYTHAQVMLTGIALFNDIPLISYLVLPVQLAAFLMTLVRKNIISSFSYHLVYGLSLLSCYVSGICSYKFYFVLPLGCVFIFLRIRRQLSKYYLWTLTFLFNRNNFFERLIELHELNLDEASINTMCILIVTCVFYFTDSMFDKRNLTETNNRVISAEMISECFHMITIKLSYDVSFKPGQYMNLFVDTEKRPYTPIYYNDNIMKFCIKSYDTGTFSENLTSLYIKDKVIYLKGAFGNKYYNPYDDTLVCNNSKIAIKNILMFSCGTGITPFYSILTNLHPNTKYTFKLLASFKTTDDAYLTNNLKCDIKLFISANGNKITTDMITEQIVKLQDVVVFICGTTCYNNMVIETCRGMRQIYYVF